MRPLYYTLTNVIFVMILQSKLLEAAEHNVIDPEIVKDGAKTLSGMRLMITGSAAMPVSVNEKWKKLTGHTLLEVSPISQAVLN